VQLQRRVTGVCTGSQFVQSVRENGGVDCGSVTGTGGGDITGVAAGTGLIGGGANGDVTLGIAPGGVGTAQIADASVGLADIDPIQVQRRVSSSCAAGLFFTAIAVDGAAVCADGSSLASNVALGASALATVTVGDQNTAVGASALENTTSGTVNVAIGSRALRLNTTGATNVAVGSWALAGNVSGNTNVAIGADALRDLTTGDGNIAIGYIAGGDITTGSNNIHIGYQGALNESETLRIGLQQTRAFIRGIRGVTTAGAAVAVLIDGAGQLGTISSSRRTKEDIEDMGDASTGLLRLRPVTFRYIQPYADGSKPRDYGLIAEEVDAVYPDLVVRNAAGDVETVQYHKLVPMLLNEMQRQQHELDRLHARLVELERRRP
jgi:hypothetical protein